jgi:ubiquinol-cytochrome c reductase iron-sulfur subunit
MTDEEQRPGSLLKVFVNAWKLYRSLAETAHKRRAQTAAEAAVAEASNLREERPENESARVRTGAWVVIGASLVWKATRLLSHRLFARPAEPGTPPVAERRTTEEGKVRTGKWLMVGALLSWKAGKSLVKKTTETFLEESAEKAGAASVGAARMAEVPVRMEPRSAEAASEAQRPAAGDGWEALQKSVSAVEHAAKKALADATPVEELPSTGREADRDLDRENDVNLEKRERRGTALATFASLAGLAGGVAFVVNFWTGGRNEWLGGSLAVFLGGFGAALVLWAHWLTAHKEAVEPRERVSSPLPEQQAVAREFCAGAGDIRRRRLLQWMGLAGMGVVGSVVISLIRSLGFPPSMALDTDVWKRGQRLMTVDGIPVSADALQPGGMIIVFPESSVGSEKTQTVLVRVRQDLLRLPAARSDWAPGGNLAYSRVCTHAGCSVGMYEANSHLLMCPCHQSTFDVLRGAQPTGGPAARALPQLPLYVDGNGHLRAAGGFSDYPGPGFWGMPS